MTANHTWEYAEEHLIKRILHTQPFHQVISAEEEKAESAPPPSRSKGCRIEEKQLDIDSVQECRETLEIDRKPQQFADSIPLYFFQLEALASYQGLHMHGHCL